MITRSLWFTTTIVVAIFCLIGCKKDKNTTALWLRQTPPVTKQPEIPKINSVVTITGTNFKTVYSYDNTGNLRSIVKSDTKSDSSYYVSFNDLNQPLYLNCVVNGFIISQTKYTVNTVGEVIRGDVYNVETDGWDMMTTTLKSYYTLTYNPSSQLTQVAYFQENGTRESESFFDYNTDGNISGIKSSGSISLEYDNFNGIGKSLKYMHLFYVEGGDNLLFYSKNNPVKINGTSRTYKYNEDKYPVEMSIASTGDTSVYSIEYDVK